MNYNSLPQGVRLAVEAAQNKKAAGISVLDLSGVGAFTSYFVICTGFSTPQVQAICTEVEEQLHKKLGRVPEHREGRASSEWALLAQHPLTPGAKYTVEVVGKVDGQDFSRRWSFTVASRWPNRATVVGISNAGSVITFRTVALVRSCESRSSVIWLLKFWTAQRRPCSNRMPSTFGTFAPAIGALAPVFGLTV